MMRTVRRLLVLGGAATAVSSLVFASGAYACGGLIGENGTIQLVRTSTLAAYHDGVERYVTSFEFVGEGQEVGSIIPLPDVPTSVERAGDWTLQRLALEVAPPVLEAATSAAADRALFDEAEVILETKIDALDITILRGGGDEVGRWASENGFFLTPDAPEILDFYAERSPIFMAARFDASRAAALGQGSGDGTPIMLTIPTDDPWVPLRILGLGLDADQQVDADVFLLTDTEPQLLAGGAGLTLERDEQASRDLLDDLRSDVGMEWVPDDMWLTYLRVGVAAGDLDYDLSVSADPETFPSIVDTGVEIPQARSVQAPQPRQAPAGDGGDRDGGGAPARNGALAIGPSVGDENPWWPFAVGAGVGAATLVALSLRSHRSHRSHRSSRSSRQAEV